MFSHWISNIYRSKNIFPPGVISGNPPRLRNSLRHYLRSPKIEVYGGKGNFGLIWAKLIKLRKGRKLWGKEILKRGQSDGISKIPIHYITEQTNTYEDKTKTNKKSLPRSIWAAAQTRWHRRWRKWKRIPETINSQKWSIKLI